MMKEIFFCLGLLLVVCFGDRDDSVLTSMEDDDQRADVSCCDGGIKSLGNTDVCVAPCCHGFTEQAVETPKIGLFTWCEKTQETAKYRRNAIRRKGRLLQKLLAQENQEQI